MTNLALAVTVIGAAAVIVVVWRFMRHKFRNDEIAVPDEPTPPQPVYNDRPVIEAEEIGHGVYEIGFYGRFDGVLMDVFPESLAAFVKQHPELRIISVCTGRESSYNGFTSSMVVLTELR